MHHFRKLKKMQFTILIYIITIQVTLYMTDINNMDDIHKDIYQNRTLCDKHYENGDFPNRTYFDYETSKISSFENQIKKNFDINFSNRLQVLNINKEDFIASLKKIGGVISGSFILQCLLNEYWSSNIDICTPYTETLLEYSNLFKTDKNKVISFKNKLAHCKNKTIFTINGVQINIILIRNPKKYISWIFKLDFLQNYYDGECLCITNFNSILNKTSYSTNIDLFDMDSDAKIEKYVELIDKISFEIQKNEENIYELEQSNYYSSLTYSHNLVNSKNASSFEYSENDVSLQDKIKTYQTLNFDSLNYEELNNFHEKKNHNHESKTELINNKLSKEKLIKEMKSISFNKKIYELIKKYQERIYYLFGLYS